MTEDLYKLKSFTGDNRLVESYPIDATESDVGTRNVTSSVLALFQDYPRSLLNFGAACCIILSIVGIPSNVISAIAIARYPRLKKNVTTLFIINLCIADCLFCGFTLPLAASTFLQRGWIHGEALCVLFPLIRYSNGAVSLQSVVAIAINRYILICHPKIYKRIYQRHWLVAMIALIWIFAFSLLLPPLIQVWGKLGFDPKSGTCTILEVDGKSPKTFLFIFSFVFTSIVFAYCYSRIYFVVRKNQKNVQEQKRNTFSKCYDSIEQASSSYKNSSFSPSIELPDQSEIPSLKSSLASKMDKKLSKDIKLLRMIFVIFLMFVVCYLPMTLVKVLKVEEKIPVVHVLGHIFIYLSACINPIIYVLMSKEYRQAYKNLYCCYQDPNVSSSGQT
ncbi:G-protein coupled receptor moody-like [Limulus polyphemus]|uniref:G-protein coupled receptor moody-like n=1 Tax=Limulus polyphemus TaxID=6850 RepID=A0ABM1C1R5_LIMPO|nr:G-protein coupled receptor moody-like [Limulus polyphemus]